MLGLTAACVLTNSSFSRSKCPITAMCRCRAQRGAPSHLQATGPMPQISPPHFQHFALKQYPYRHVPSS